MNYIYHRIYLLIICLPPHITLLPPNTTTTLIPARDYMYIMAH